MVIKENDLTVTSRTTLAPQKPFSGYTNCVNTILDSVKISDCFVLTSITLTNNSNKTIRNIEIELTDYSSDKSGICKGCYVKEDSIFSFKDETKIKIKELRPNREKEVSIYSTKSGIEDDDIVTTDSGTFTIRPEIIAYPSNDVDEFFTTLFVENRMVQILIYIFTVCGVYYFVGYIIPYLFKFIPTKKPKD
jgi:hypothetical protein